MFNIKIIDNMLEKFFNNCSKQYLAKNSVLFAVITSAFLVFIKAIGLFINYSLSMRASLNDSCMDAFVSFAAYYALRFASINRDSKHNFGHDKIEGIVAIFQCLIILYSGFIIFKEAYEFCLDPQPSSDNMISIVIMLISCICVYQLVYFQKYVAKKTGSIIVKGDSLHYLSDLFMNVCVMISLWLSHYFVYVDVVCGVSVGIYVVYNAFIIMKNAINDLMDEALPDDIQKNISDIITSIDGINSIESMRTRSAGMKKYVEIVVNIDGKFSLNQASIISEKAEQKIINYDDSIDVIIKPKGISEND